VQAGIVANSKHLAKIKEGIRLWNQWRRQYPDVRPDLYGADLVGANLQSADLTRANLVKANLSEANLSKAKLKEAGLWRANLTRANIEKADLLEADFSEAVLREANLKDANLEDANLWGADLSRANLSGADLSGATLVDTNLDRADLSDCSVFGISVWNVHLEGAIQSNLLITPEDELPIQVDNLEVAQFVYLLLNNEKIRTVIDTITSKAVLILGRFTPERKDILNTIRDELRKRDYLPILFDFEKPNSKDLTGTLLTLANMAGFIIADLTDPSSVPYELARLVPNTVVPVQTIIKEGQREFAMFMDLRVNYSWVLMPYQYKSKQLLISNLDKRVIAPAEAMAKKLAQKYKGKSSLLMGPAR
jgi:hypothetical protein